jgi:uncharacterized spore protein YtfJ
VQPVGFLVVGEDTVKMLPAQTNGAMERVVELLPQLLEDLSRGGEKKPASGTAYQTASTLSASEPKADEYP